MNASAIPPIWTRILQAAVWTPSPHNTQPWKIRIHSDTEAALFIDRTRMLPDEDVTGNFIRCAMGMFLEAISLAAAEEGYAPVIEILKPAPAALIPFATIRLQKTPAAVADYPTALFRKRQTSRLHYEGVPPVFGEALSALAKMSGQHYQEMRDPQLIEAILERNIDAVFEDLNQPRYHDEIIRWFRCWSKDAESRRDGLDARCMNLPGLEMWFMGRFPKAMRHPLLRPWVKRLYRRQLGRTPVLAALSGPFWAPDKAVQAGRFLMRFWLELAKNNLFLHPFGNLVTNESAVAWMRKKLNAPELWLVFRIGKTDTPPQSLRLSWEDLLV